LTAQDRLVKGMRVAGVTTLEQANHYLETEFLPWVNATLAVVPASADDAHRPLEKQHDLAAILSHVESRQVENDYKIGLDKKVYKIDRQDICLGLRGADVRVEKRRDGSVAVRFRDRYLRITECTQQPKVASAKPARVPAPSLRNLYDGGDLAPEMARSQKGAEVLTPGGSSRPAAGQRQRTGNRERRVVLG
jgi:hypothetical protein